MAWLYVAAPLAGNRSVGATRFANKDLCIPNRRSPRSSGALRARCPLSAPPRPAGPCERTFLCRRVRLAASRARAAAEHVQHGQAGCAPRAAREASADAHVLRHVPKLNRNVRLVLVYAITLSVISSLISQTPLAAYILLVRQESGISHDYGAVGVATGLQGVVSVLVALPAGIIADQTRRHMLLRMSSSAWSHHCGVHGVVRRLRSGRLARFFARRPLLCPLRLVRAVGALHGPALRAPRGALWRFDRLWSALQALRVALVVEDAWQCCRPAYLDLRVLARCACPPPPPATLAPATGGPCTHAPPATPEKPALFPLLRPCWKRTRRLLPDLPLRPVRRLCRSHPPDRVRRGQLANGRAHDGDACRRGPHHAAVRHPPMLQRSPHARRGIRLSLPPRPARCRSRRRAWSPLRPRSASPARRACRAVRASTTR